MTFEKLPQTEVKYFSDVVHVVNEKPQDSNSGRGLLVQECASYWFPALKMVSGHRHRTLRAL